MRMLKRVVQAPVLLVVLLTLTLPRAFADEGMWTFNNFPSAKVGQAYGYTPDAAWLDHLRLSSVRIAGGCSASIVSAQGLVMTNHHCARECLENLSGLAQKDYLRDGFLAKSEADEPRCPGMEMNKLTAITDVTRRVQAATKEVSVAAFNDAQRAVMAGIEKECATSDDYRCEVVTLYRGGRYDLYKYERFQDIRLAFAPEERIAFFGGDPDNFMFPRYDLDVSMLRIYGRDGKPLRNAEHLAWSDGTIKEGDLTFVAGNPGGTSRGLTVAQLANDRDWQLVNSLLFLAEFRGLLTEYQARGPEQKRHSTGWLFGIENGLKALRGRHDALADKTFYGQLVANENAFRARVMADPALAQRYGGVWDRIAAIVEKDGAYRTEYEALERGVRSELYGIARRLVRYGAEIEKPNGERLAEYSEARLPQMRSGILANEPLYDEFDIATLTWSLTQMRERLGPDHPAIQRVFGRRSPAEIATAAVTGSRLKEMRTDAQGNASGGYRKALWDGGKPAIEASGDPMIELARAIDPAARAIRMKMETEVFGPLKQQQELLAQARFAVYGDSIYPDATFSLRLSYGRVSGWVTTSGQAVTPFTTIGGAFARATGADPFALPDSWLQARPRLNLDTPMNFVTTNDIIGGNSGSPLVDRRGEIAGLVFDGNLESLGGDYGFDAAVNRTVAVHSGVVLEAMEKIYGAGRLVRELTGSKTVATVPNR